MSLVFYIGGIVTGYIAWRLAHAPRLWSAEEEARLWRSKWISAQIELDKSKDNE
jgi:hypothetical protein